MTRLLRGRRSPVEPRHRALRPGRHRADRTPSPVRPGRAERTTHPRAARPPRRRRRARYAAAGLLALAGSVATPVLRPEPAAHVVTVRALAVAPSAAVVPARRPQPVRRAAPRRGHYKWVTRTVDGAVLHGRATWYGPGFAGRRTASGETFRPHAALTAAHRTLPFGTLLRVCRARRCVVVRVNDRGPFGNAILDLSWLAASRIGLERPGIAPVTATVLHATRVRVAA